MLRITKLYLICFVAFVSLNAFSIGSAGCGVGSLIISNNAWYLQIFAASTNATFTKQFSLTTGTSNCKPGLFGLMEKQSEFLATNFNLIQKELAQGSGDSLQSYATVLGCPNSVQNLFNSWTQKHFNEIFTNKDVQSVLTQTKDILNKEPVLSSVCEYIRI